MIRTNRKLAKALSGALAACALVAPAADASGWDGPPPDATTAAARQQSGYVDLRSPDTRQPPPSVDLRSPDAKDAGREPATSPSNEPDGFDALYPAVGVALGVGLLVLTLTRRRSRHRREARLPAVTG
jgi:hypothetical protein